MVEYVLSNGPYLYRPLRLVSEGKRYQTGWDVYALQTALKNLTLDGVFGPDTHARTLVVQRNFGLVVDGIVGPATQHAIVAAIAIPRRDRYQLPINLLKGQIEKESGWLVGNHTAPYNDGSRDIGIVQRNDRFTTWEEAFNVSDSIEKIANHTRMKKNVYLEFVGNHAHAWKLAAGSWNAPAWTDRLARGETLLPTQEAHINAYIDRVTSFCTEKALSRP
jgi:hypothetical protein